MPGAPAWLVNVAVNQWVEIPSSTMSTVATGMGGVGTNPRGRMNAWNGYALKGTDVYSVRQGGHTDYWGNEVLKFDLASNTPAWTIVKPSSPDPSVIRDNVSRYTDGSPAAVHGYYNQRYVAQRDWIMSVGTTAMPFNGGTNGDCVVYDVAQNTYLDAGTIPDATIALPEFGVFDDPTTGNVYHLSAYTIHRWNQASNTWTLNVASVPRQYGYPSVACTDTTRRRAVILSGDAQARTPYVFDFTTSMATEITPTGATAVIDSTGKYGITYCPTTDRFYLMNHQQPGATGLSEMNPTTFEITPMATTGGATLPDSAAAGVFSRFLYVAPLRGIVYFPQYSANAWFLRLH